MADNLIGPYTNQFKVKTVFHENESNYYFLIELDFSRKFGDMYNISYSFFGMIPLNIGSAQIML